MLALQIKAFTLLAAILLLVDALAFHGEYRERIGHELGKVASLVGHFHGLGPGRDWSQRH